MDALLVHVAGLSWPVAVGLEAAWYPEAQVVFDEADVGGNTVAAEVARAAAARARTISFALSRQSHVLPAMGRPP
jgi:hypothetical protein